jgi:5-methylcytosine-specific restriction protein A
MSKQNEPTYRCALCRREVRIVTRHHLIPKSEGGHEVVDLCLPCHRTLHSFFSNETLLKELHDIQTIRQNPEIARYLKWVRKQPDRAIRVRTSRIRR